MSRSVWREYYRRPLPVILTNHSHVLTLPVAPASSSRPRTLTNRRRLIHCLYVGSTKPRASDLQGRFPNTQSVAKESVEGNLAKGRIASLMHGHLVGNPDVGGRPVGTLVGSVRQNSGIIFSKVPDSVGYLDPHLSTLFFEPNKPAFQTPLYLTRLIDVTNRRRQTDRQTDTNRKRMNCVFSNDFQALVQFSGRTRRR